MSVMSISQKPHVQASVEFSVNAACGRGSVHQKSMLTENFRSEVEALINK